MASSSGPVSGSVEADNLTKELMRLQQSASVVADQQRVAGKALYKHLAELYMWWRSASAILISDQPQPSE